MAFQNTEIWKKGAEDETLHGVKRHLVENTDSSLEAMECTLAKRLKNSVDTTFASADDTPSNDYNVNLEEIKQESDNPVISPILNTESEETITDSRKEISNDTVNGQIILSKDSFIKIASVKEVSRNEYDSLPTIPLSQIKQEPDTSQSSPISNYESAETISVSQKNAEWYEPQNTTCTEEMDKDEAADSFSAPSKGNKKRHETEEMVDASYEILQNLSRKKKENSKETAFGNYVSEKLKVYDTVRKCLVIRDIIDVFLKHDIEIRNISNFVKN